MNYPGTLYALIIGIGNYRHPTFKPLKGAISDAQSFERFVLSDLGVPKGNVLTLYDAKRADIVNALIALAQNSYYRRGSAFVVYYAGHGASVVAPAGWQTENGKLQMIIPADYDGRTYGILDQTIGLLLEQLAEAKGDNITVVFDCCYSGSGTRDLSIDEEVVDREVEITDPVPENLDDDLLPATRGSAITPELQYHGLRSHVLLSACRSDERARESGGVGYFTAALVRTLKTVDLSRTTYTELMRELPVLPSQTPQCEGTNRNEIIFRRSSGSSHARRNDVHKVSRNPATLLYEIPVGETYGIRKETEFAIYQSPEQVARSAPLTMCGIASMDGDKSILNIPKTTVIHAQDLVALISRMGGDPFVIYLSVADYRSLQQLFSGLQTEAVKRGDRAIVSTGQPAMANFGLEYRDRKLYLSVLDPRISRHGLRIIPYAMAPTLDETYEALYAAALFDYHLSRSSRSLDLTHVGIAVYQLIRVSNSSDVKSVAQKYRYISQGGNLLRGDYVEVPITSEKKWHGIEITNRTSTALYPSVFYFDHTGLAIQSYYQPGVAAGTVEPPLQPQQSLTIGYGSSGHPPLVYSLEPGQDIDVGTVKIFLSVQAVDLSHLVQSSPFNGRKGGIKQGGPRPVWGTISFQVVQKRAK